MFTAVSEARFRKIAATLVREGQAPRWFADIEYIQWSGFRKDLRLIPGSRVTDSVLVDDMEDYVTQGQEAQWIAIKGFDGGDAEPDSGLMKTLEALEERASGLLASDSS